MGPSLKIALRKIKLYYYVFSRKWKEGRDCRGLLFLLKQMNVLSFICISVISLIVTERAKFAARIRRTFLITYDSI